MSAPLAMPDKFSPLTPVPECVREACISALRQHEAGQIFDIEHFGFSKVTVELEVIHPLGVLTWSMMFTAFTTSGTFFWLAKVSASDAPEIQPGELSDVKLSVYDPNRDTWTHALTYKHPFSSDHTMWLSDINTPYLG